LPIFENQKHYIIIYRIENPFKIKKTEKNSKTPLTNGEGSGNIKRLSQKGGRLRYCKGRAWQGPKKT
jgi:hypothetical protein